MTRKFFAPVAVLLVLVLGIYGCNSPEPDGATPPTAAEGNPSDHDSSAHDDAADHDHDDASHDQEAQKSDMEKMTESLASFSPEDRESAMKQHFCPVSGEMLGTMGEPKKVDVDGQPVWICCDGCKDKLLAEPEKYLAKLAK